MKSCKKFDVSYLIDFVELHRNDSNEVQTISSELIFVALKCYTNIYVVDFRTSEIVILISFG